jgi:Transglutaminase-like superfamily
MRASHRFYRDLAVSLLTGTSQSSKQLPRHSALTWMRAIWQSIYVLSSFDAGRSRLAQDKLARISHSPMKATYPPVLACAAVHADAHHLRFWLHLLLGKRACYAESLALCAGLRMIGWDCAVVIGYGCVDMDTDSNMHAWVEFAGEIVSDPLDVASGYCELMRIGGQ